MALGFFFFGFQAFSLWFVTKAFLFGAGLRGRFLAVLLFLTKLMSYSAFLLFFAAQTVSLVDFFLGALLSFVLFLCLFARSFRAFL